MSRESHIRTSLHFFLVAFFSVMGALLGFIAFVAIFSVLQREDGAPKRQFTVEIEPNAEGVRHKVSDSAPVILKLNISGVIGVEKLRGETIRELLVESREGLLKNDRVKGILLYINSPGGTVSDADEIYRALLQYKTKYKTPIIAHVDGLCASGGMYIACAADQINATDASLVGSIGVLIPPFFNVAKLLEKIGVDSMTLYAGKGKDDLNPTRPWKAGEEKPLQSIVDGYYKNFVGLVLKNRPRMTESELVETLGAQVFLAPEAKEYGYIDETGASIEDALRILLKSLDIEGEEYQVVSLNHSSLIDSLFDNRFFSPLSITKRESKYSSWIEQLSLLDQFLYLYIP